MRSHDIARYAVLGVLVLAAGAARAQDWREYDYPEAGFAAQFPVQPTVAEVQYRAAGLAAPAKVWSARQGSAEFSVTVADLSAADPGKEAAIAAAVKALAAGGRIKLDVEARIDRQFGRELSVLGRDGDRTVTAIFYVDRKLYVLAGRTDAEGSGLGARFQQSLQFIGADGRPPRRPEDGPGFGPPPGEVAQNDPDGEGGLRGRRRRPPPEAFAGCQGKAAGDAVQLQTRRGDAVAATCVQTPEGLAARPNRPFRGRPPEGPPPEG